jgi:hypothetical protein
VAAAHGETGSKKFDADNDLRPVVRSDRGAVLNTIPVKTDTLRPRAATWVVVAALLLTGCSGGPEVGPQPTPAAGSPTVEASAGLVPPAHPQCNLGPLISHYLATGDNQGHPRLDQQLSQDVGVPVPQARAIADRYIEACDRQADDRAHASAAAASEAIAEASTSASRAAADAVHQAKAKQSCAAIGGRYSTNDDECYTTVHGNPSGRPGSDCDPGGYPIWVTLNDDGSLAGSDYETAKDFYPGCFK